MLTIRQAQVDALAAVTPGGQAIQRCPLSTRTIEIELIGEDDCPIPRERYRLTSDDGSVKEGVLDSDGGARIEIGPGICTLTFPDLDSEAWEPV